MRHGGLVQGTQIALQQLTPRLGVRWLFTCVLVLVCTVGLPIYVCGRRILQVLRIVRTKTENPGYSSNERIVVMSQLVL
jgi:hypothetical protein